MCLDTKKSKINLIYYLGGRIMKKGNLLLLWSIGLMLFSCGASSSSQAICGGETTIIGVSGQIQEYVDGEAGDCLPSTLKDGKSLYEVNAYVSYVLAIEPKTSGGCAVAILTGDNAAFDEQSFCEISFFGGINNDTAYLLTFQKTGEFEPNFTVTGHSSSLLFNCSSPSSSD